MDNKDSRPLEITIRYKEEELRISAEAVKNLKLQINGKTVNLGDATRTVQAVDDKKISVAQTKPDTVKKEIKFINPIIKSGFGNNVPEWYPAWFPIGFSQQNVNKEAKGYVVKNEKGDHITWIGDTTKGFWVSTYPVSMERSSVIKSKSGCNPLTNLDSRYFQAYIKVWGNENQMPSVSKSINVDIISNSEYNKLCQWIEKCIGRYFVVENSTTLGNYASSKDSTKQLNLTGSYFDKNVGGIVGPAGNVKILTKEGSTWGGSYKDDGELAPMATQTVHNKEHKNPFCGTRFVIKLKSTK